MNFRSICKSMRHLATRLGVFVALSLVVNESAMADIIAGPFIDPSNGHSYSLLNWTSWTGSEAQAESLGGHLATIRNASEDNWVYTTFQPYLPNLVPTATVLWIGLNDLGTPGNFHWAS